MKRLTISVSEKDKDQFSSFAEEHGMTLSGFIKKACKESIKRYYSNQTNTLEQKLQRLVLEAEELYNIVATHKENN